MRHHLTRAAAIAALAFANVAAAQAQAGDAADAQVSALAGTWVITSEGRRGPQDSVFTVTQTDAGLEGIWVGPRGNALTVRNLQVDGDSFSFGITFRVRIINVDLTYRGTIAGDTLSGTIDTPRGEQPFTGVRREAGPEAAADD